MTTTKTTKPPVTKRQIEEVWRGVRGAQHRARYHYDQAGSRTWVDYQAGGFTSARRWTPSPEERIAALENAEHAMRSVAVRALHTADAIAIYREWMEQQRAAELERLG